MSNLDRFKNLLKMVMGAGKPVLTDCDKVVDLAMAKYYGIREYPAPSQSPTILSWKRHFWPDIKSDSEFAWCAVFMWNICEEFGYERTKSALARDWLKVGEPVETPEYGDVVVFSRGSEPWMGHVGFVIRVSEAHGVVYTFGGNQANSVNIRAYEIDRVLGYRRLKKDE